MLAIEPMVNMGRPAVKVLSDGWTAVTSDGSLSAHFEHSVAVTSAGPWILTALPAPAAFGAGGLVAGEPGLRRMSADDVEVEVWSSAAAVRALPGAAGGGGPGSRRREAGAAHGTSRRTCRRIRGAISCGS